MTGHGQALLHDGPYQVFTEVRSVNNRFLKVNVLGELTAEQNAELDGMLRQSVRRGTVTVRIQVDRAHDPNQFRINPVAIAAYRQQAAEYFPDESIPGSVLLSLPGVIEDHSVDPMDDRVWPTVVKSMELAIERLDDMRRREGAAMRETLADHLSALTQCLDHVHHRVPLVVTAYRQRLTERIGQLLAEQGATVNQSDLVREVGLFAERTDVSEEIVRLRSHINQCRGAIDEADSSGRKLDFLTQEMLRESNTIGSKANDAEIAQRVVEMKSIIDRMRELVQNVE